MATESGCVKQAASGDGQGRVAEIRTADDELIIHDPENADAWLQSDYVVEVGRDV
jgi:hypothetical protein